MEPRIQYAKTSDGVSIAYAVRGKGPALVCLRSGIVEFKLEWEVPEFRTWNERLAQKRMLVQYDNRGTGLSERDVTDFSLEALQLDIAAVADSLSLGKFAIFATVNTGPVAVAYAARHPDRVSHLILWCSYARGSELLKSPQNQALRHLIENWELYTDTLAHYMFGWLGGEPARRVAARMRESITHETYRAYQAQLNRVDVTDLLPHVKAPTLVLHRRQFPLVSIDAATDLASGIPNARLALLEGESAGYALEDSQAVLDAIDEFLDEGEEASAELAGADVRTILFTDMQSSTALTERLGDAAAQDIRRAHNQIVRAALDANDGREIKHTGDGIMASFSTASSALDSAIAIQRGVASHKEAHTDSPLGVYIGLNAGEPIAEEGDLFGTSINLASRICDHAEPGQIVAANVVRELASGKGFLFSDLGETELRGFEDPVRLYEVRWREES